MKNDKTKTFKKNITAITTEKGRQEKALVLHNRLIEIRKNFIGNAFLFIATMLVMEKEEYWKEMDASSFEQYCCIPDVDCGIEVDTIKKYIRILKKAFERGLEEEEIRNISINKLALVIGTKRPMEWLEEAKLLGINDLRDKIAVEDRGETEPEPKVKKIHNMTCPHCGKVIEL